MQTMELLGATMGLGALSGISLYLTVFVVGFSLNMGWLILQPGLEPLETLAEPWIWTLALVFYLLEFFADKVPWVDSLWDAIHTIIRPVGAMFVSITVLGQTHPSVEVLGALLAGGAAATTHLTKSGTRLLINSSPEPVSNIVTSIFEDVIVVVGSVLTVRYPLYAMGAVIVFAIIFVFLAPRIFRMAKAYWIFVLGKLNVNGARQSELKTYLPHEFDIALGRLLGVDEKVEWALPCLTGKLKGVGGHVRGYLVKTSARNRIYFVGKKLFRVITSLVTSDVFKVENREGFLYDEVVFYQETAGVFGRFRFSKKHQTLVKQVCQQLEQDVASTPVVASSSSVEQVS
ncbi:MAG: DUF4126 domain-containing protein [Verrucomicrobiia bacterium]